MNNTWVREEFTPYVAGGSQDPFNEEDPTYNGGTLHITTTPANTQLEEVLSDVLTYPFDLTPSRLALLIEDYQTRISQNQIVLGA